jgi:hypothetical protein
MLIVLGIGGGVLLASVLSYGVAVLPLVRLLVRLTPPSSALWGFWKGVAVMMLVTLLTAVVHLLHIALWAAAVLLCGVLSSFEQAFYYSAGTYTAMGTGDVVLPGPWRLLGPLEAINGLLLFGLSTAVMFAVLSRLVTNSLHERGGGTT